MFQIDIKPGEQRLSVQLKVDLGKYFWVCKHIKNADNLKIKLDSDMEAIYQFEREQLLRSLTGLAGELHWVEIKKILAQQFNLADPEEKKLASALSGGTPRKSPLALEVLNHCFIELIKNSIDQLIKINLYGMSDQISLEMYLQLEIKADTLWVVFTDNAGGFSDEYLHYFSNDKKSPESRKRAFSVTKANETKYFLGGQGLGMQQLCNILLHGNVLDCSGQLFSYYSVSEGHTSIAIKNNELKGGAEIILQSPLKPFECVEPMFPQVVHALVNGRQNFLKPLKNKRLPTAEAETRTLEYNLVDSAVCSFSA